MSLSSLNLALVIKGNGAEKVGDLEHGVFPCLHVMQKADAFAFPSHSSFNVMRLRPRGAERWTHRE